MVGWYRERVARSGSDQDLSAEDIAEQPARKFLPVGPELLTAPEAPSCAAIARFHLGLYRPMA